LYNFYIIQSLAKKLEPSENLLISPFSLASVLAMALAGAKENTAIQLKETLQLTNFTDEEIYTTIGNLVRSVKVILIRILGKIICKQKSLAIPITVTNK